MPRAVKSRLVVLSARDRDSGGVSGSRCVSPAAGWQVTVSMAALASVGMPP
jgi:hypothetical protein